MRVAGSVGRGEYTAVYSRRVLLASVFPRAIMQAAFYVLIGQLLGGADGVRWAFVGVVGYALVTATVVRLPDVLAADKQDGTVFRLRMGVLGPTTVAGCRSWPYLVEGLVSALLVLAVAGPVLGMGDLAVRMLPALPVLGVAALSCAAFGLAAAALSVGRGSEVLVGNLLASVMLVCCQVIVPVDVGWLNAIGAALPLTHALNAVRAQVAGANPVPEAALELVVGLGWLALATVVLHVQAVRSARTGSDDFQ